MRTAGIICEYNPFHRGHLLQLEKTRGLVRPDGAIVCLMSGYFVQRGEPALYPPRLRAEAAVRSGADLVLELPITAAVNAAGYFAEKAVWCLDRLGCVDTLSFGSECGSLLPLSQAADLLDSPELEEALREELSTGVSYAAARAAAMERLGADGAILSQPNNALGIEYIRSIQKLGSTMEPWTFQRDMEIPSAGMLRQRLTDDTLLYKGENPQEGDSPERWLPQKRLYCGAAMHTLQNGERAMLAVLRSLPDEAFARMAFEAEGISSKVKKACRTENSLDGILSRCKSKRFAYSRLKRTLLCLYLGLNAGEMQREIPYLRVLAMNDRGRQVLAQARKRSELPLVSGAIPRTTAAEEYFALEQRAADLYTLFAPAETREEWGQLRAAHPTVC